MPQLALPAQQLHASHDGIPCEQEPQQVSRVLKGALIGVHAT